MKTKSHKERLGLGTLTLNRGILSQDSRLRDMCHKWQTFFKNRPEDRNDPQPDPSVQPKARGLLHMEREYIAHHIGRRNLGLEHLIASMQLKKYSKD